MYMCSHDKHINICVFCVLEITLNSTVGTYLLHSTNIAVIIGLKATS